MNDSPREGFWCPNSFPECENSETCCYPDMCPQGPRRTPQLSDEELRDEHWYLPELETTK